MQCPICGAIADNITRPDLDGLGVRCHNCGDFDVAERALNDLLRLDGAERVAALDRAKRFAPAAARPVINTLCLSQREGAADPGW